MKPQRCFVRRLFHAVSSALMVSALAVGVGPAKSAENAPSSQESTFAVWAVWAEWGNRSQGTHEYLGAQRELPSGKILAQGRYRLLARDGQYRYYDVRAKGPGQISLTFDRKFRWATLVFNGRVTACHNGQGAVCPTSGRVSRPRQVYEEGQLSTARRRANETRWNARQRARAPRAAPLRMAYVRGIWRQHLRRIPKGTMR